MAGPILPGDGDVTIATPVNRISCHIVDGEERFYIDGAPSTKDEYMLTFEACYRFGKTLSNVELLAPAKNTIIKSYEFVDKNA